MFPIKVKLLSAKELEAIEKPEDGEELHGLFDHEVNTIYVVDSLEQHQREHVFYHEFCHAIDRQLEPLDEEAKCDIMATFYMKEFTSVSHIIRQNVRYGEFFI